MHCFLETLEKLLSFEIQKLGFLFSFQFKILSQIVVTMWKITVEEISLSSNICFPFLLIRPSIKTDGELQLVEKMLKSQPFNFTRVRKREMCARA
jgi:hypothetical protein